MFDDGNDHQQPASPDNLSTQVQADALSLPQQPPSLPLVRGCVKLDHFTRWKRDLPSMEMGWLSAQFVLMAPLTQERQHIDPAFINRMMAKKLSDKISKCGKSHLKCNETVKKKVEDVIERAIDNGAALWRKANERRLKVTEFCLCTAYAICKNDLSFMIQTALVELQQLDGLNLSNRNSDEACQNILIFIGEKTSAS